MCLRAPPSVVFFSPEMLCKPWNQAHALWHFEVERPMGYTHKCKEESPVDSLWLCANQRTWHGVGFYHNVRAYVERRGD